MRPLRRYCSPDGNVFTVPLVMEVTGLHRESARARLQQYENGTITKARLLRPAQVTKPKKRQL